MRKIINTNSLRYAKTEPARGSTSCKDARWGEGTREVQFLQGCEWVEGGRAEHILQECQNGGGGGWVGGRDAATMSRRYHAVPRAATMSRRYHVVPRADTMSRRYHGAPPPCRAATMPRRYHARSDACDRGVPFATACVASGGLCSRRAPKPCNVRRFVLVEVSPCSHVLQGCRGYCCYGLTIPLVTPCRWARAPHAFGYQKCPLVFCNGNFSKTTFQKILS